MLILKMEPYLGSFGEITP